MKNIILREVAGEYILVPVGEAAQRIRGIVTMTQSGAFLWEQLQKPCEMEELIQAFLKEYEIDRQTAETDVADFIKKLQQRGLLCDEEN